MWSSLKRRSGTQLGHEKRDMRALDTVLLRSKAYDENAYVIRQQRK